MPIRLLPLLLRVPTAREAVSRTQVALRIDLWTQVRIPGFLQRVALFVTAISLWTFSFARTCATANI